MRQRHPHTKSLRCLISGGGTGGHVFPAIAIADAIKDRQPGAGILFVGAKGKMEMEKVPRAGYPIEGLWISGFAREFTVANLLFPFKLLHSLWNARRILKAFQPDIVIGVGGYASGPALQVAKRRGVPYVIQEQNSYPGVTNKILARAARKIFVAFDGMETWFPKEKIFNCGNPVRKGLTKLHNKKQEALEYFKLNVEKKTILIIGGSLGARTLNEAVVANTEILKNKKDEIQLLWQVGKFYEAEFEVKQVAALPNVKMTAFIDRMDLAYAAADILIGRAGALTVSEFCLVGKPAILIPSPNVAADHQTKNAKALSDKNAAILIRDAQANEMIEQAIEILKDKEKVSQLAHNIRHLAKPRAAGQIADEILKIFENEKAT